MHENTGERMNRESLASMVNIQGSQGLQVVSTFIQRSNALNQSPGGVDMIIESNNIVNKLNLKASEEQKDENTG